MKVETDLLYQNYALFLQATKSFGKNLKQNHYFPFETSTFKSMCTIFRMDAQLYTKGNREI